MYAPARLRFDCRDFAPDNCDAPRPPGLTAILFSQSHDVIAMRAVPCDRGGSPNEIEKVNWIKMQMFEIRDSDGHPLWFG
jgi:hypothetical protein